MAKAKRKPTPKAQGARLLKLDFGPIDFFSSERRRQQRMVQLLMEMFDRKAAERPIDNRPSPSPSVRKLSGKAWVPDAFARRPAELLAMGITGASHALAEEYQTDCGKSLEARYIEKLLRDLGEFPKKRRK